MTMMPLLMRTLFLETLRLALANLLWFYLEHKGNKWMCRKGTNNNSKNLGLCHVEYMLAPLLAYGDYSCGTVVPILH